MKIKLNSNDQQEIKKIFETFETNETISEMYQEYLTNLYDEIDKVSIKEITSFENCSDESAFTKCLMNLFEIDVEDEENKQLIDQYFAPNIHQLDATDYQSNAYYKNIHFSKTTFGKWKLNNDYFLPYEGFNYNEIIVDENNYFAELPQIGFFKERVAFQAVSENDVTWMSITPHEIETMKEAVNHAFGNVITFGLGLGYFTYMCSLKDNVRKIVVIERDQKVIDLFTRFILPQFSHKEKIEIIKADAIGFLDSNINKFDFDYSFVDLWHNVDDGIKLYINFKRREENISHVRFDYWIEKSLLAFIRRCLIILLEEQFHGDNNDYSKAENLSDEIINNLYAATKDIAINSYNEVVTLLKDNNLKELAKLL